MSNKSQVVLAAFSMTFDEIKIGKKCHFFDVLMNNLIMSAIVIRSEFWNNPIVQYLKNRVPKTVSFRESKGILVDILVPFCNSISFYVVDAKDISNSTFDNLNRMASSFKTITVIVKTDPEYMPNYLNLMSQAPPNISCITYFPSKNFDKSCAILIWNIIENSPVAQRNMTSIIEERRRILMNPTETARTVIENLIQDEEKKAQLMGMLSQKGMTLRTVLLQGVPELFKYNFLLEPTQQQ